MKSFITQLRKKKKKKGNKMLETFRESLQKNLNEGVLDTQVKRISGKAKTLQKVIDDFDKSIRKTITKELGPGYNKDIDSIISGLEDVIDEMNELNLWIDGRDRKLK
jgi:uncharacterized protein Yka (UPF0111/DUF47 family)